MQSWTSFGTQRHYHHRVSDDEGGWRENGSSTSDQQDGNYDTSWMALGGGQASGLMEFCCGCSVKGIYRIKIDEVPTHDCRRCWRSTSLIRVVIWWSILEHCWNILERSWLDPNEARSLVLVYRQWEWYGPRNDRWIDCFPEWWLRYWKREKQLSPISRYIGDGVKLFIIQLFCDNIQPEIDDSRGSRTAWGLCCW